MGICLLPFIEQDTLYQLFDPRIDARAQRFTSGPDVGRRLDFTKVPTYNCPSDKSEGITFNQFNNARWANNYQPSRGPFQDAGNNSSCPCTSWAAINSTYASGGHPNRDFHPSNTSNYNGPAGMFIRNGLTSSYPFWWSKLIHAPDGLSNVIFFGEVRERCSDHIRLGWSDPHGSGLCSTMVPINWDSCADNRALAPGQDGCRARCNWNMEFGFRSMHPGGATFLLGDGSVHFISQTIDHWAYQYLGDRDDNKNGQF
jgi:prepilin-type processing-associated H-X9-DG protein